MSDTDSGITVEDGNSPHGTSDANDGGPGLRKRGRPRKFPGGIGGGNHDTLNPADIGGATNSGGDGTGEPAARSRRTYRKRTDAKETPLRVEMFMIAWAGAASALASLTQIPEFNINADQTKTLADASVNVARHFPAFLTEKQQDIATFMGAIALVGMTQHALYTQRRRGERARDITPAPMSVDTGGHGGAPPAEGFGPVETGTDFTGS